MTPERWRKVTQVFHEARARDAAVRGAFLDEACAGDPALRAEVDGMLEADRDAGQFGESAVAGAADEQPRLEPGAQIGPYRVESLVGSGGMGEVYRARDTRLDRSVALKVLPMRVASDPGLRQRLEREARALAALSHPHICPIYDVGHQDGVDYLVMEYLEGETLARRLVKGPLPLSQALRCAIEIADALDKAHGRGIVHRDLKPGNVMLTKSGTKLLDFGLAKLRRPPLAVRAEHATGTAGVEPPLTERGSIVGTLHYMAPEQLGGGEADARTDIFAFGGVMYEMVTGRKAFDGKSQASIIAAILDHEPAAASMLQPTSPPALDHLIRTCLAKEPDRRWQSAGDLGRQLTWLLAEASTPSAAVALGARQTRPSPRRALQLAAAVAMGGLLAGLGAWYTTRVDEPRPIVRLDYQLPPSHEIRNADRAVMAFSADGSHFVYNTTKGLYLRSLRESEARLIPGTEENLSNPFFSPDGHWVGYFAGGGLKKISTSGGAVTPLCEAEPPFGASWGTDDTIVFGQSRGIIRVSARGGAPTLIVPAQAGEVLDSPQLLEGGRHVLLTATRSSGAARWDDAQIVAHDLASGDRKVLWTGGSAARYVPTGHLVYAARDVLFALSFDVDGLTASGRPAALVTNVHRSLLPSQHAGFASFAVSDSGTLVYLRAEDVARHRVLGFADRQGGVQELDVPPGPYVNPRLSPDGRRLLVQTLNEEGRGDVWVYDLSGRSQIRQLTMGGHSRYPMWTPDSARVTFVSDRDGTTAIDLQRIDGHAPERLRLVSSYGRPDSWSPDGSTLAYRSAGADESSAAIWTLEPGTGREPVVFHDLPGSDQYESAFSPDGKWLAYTSTETGADEVFVQPFPATGAKVRVTQRGGGFPIWSPNGRELFYRRSFDRGLNRSHGARLFAVDIATNNGVEFGPERELPVKGFLVFNSYRDYDIAPDNKRFLMVFPAGGSADPPRITVVQNWFEELKVRVPAP